MTSKMEKHSKTFLSKHFVKRIWLDLNNNQIRNGEQYLDTYVHKVMRYTCELELNSINEIYTI